MKKNRNFMNFQKISISTIFGWLGSVVKIFTAKLFLIPVMYILFKNFHANFQPNRRTHSKVMRLCHFFIWQVGWVGWAGRTHLQNTNFFFMIPLCKNPISRKKSCVQLLGFQRYRHFCKLDKLSFFFFKIRKILTSPKKKITTMIVR